jgi:hypothetical protein
MAHFAQLNDANIVIDVIVVSNATIDNLPFPQSESVGVAFCQSLYGNNTIWKQTSYNGNFRKNYAGVGGAYDPYLDAFILPKPYPSWVLDVNTCQWIPPVAKPTTGGVWTWNEATMSWDNIPKPYPSWILNSTETGWVAPVPVPKDGQMYVWDEATLSWVEIPPA